MSKASLFDAVDAQREHLESMAADIWETPELGLHEEESSKVLQEALDAEGFDVDVGVGGMPTAFVASYGEGDPRIGILGEFDALPGLSQRVSAERDPIEEGAPGHGCGHNLFGVAGVGAAIATKRALEDGDVSGTVEFFGCPAEETLVGKTFMARDGAFDHLDAAVTWHPSDRTRPQLGSSLALDSVQFTFEGESAHAAGSPEAGRSALDGVELLNTGVEYMREHVPEKARIHYAITDGGDAPNVVPAEATVWYFVRAPTREGVERLSDWLTDIAEGAALMTQTDVERRYVTGCWNFVANETVTDVVWDNVQTLGPVEFDEEDRAFARELKETIADEKVESSLEDPPEEVAAEMREAALYGDPIEPYDEGEIGGGSTEVADVSWITPTAQFRATTWPVGTPAHTWQAVAANGDFGFEGCLYAAKVQAGTVYDLMADEDLVETAREEFEAVTGDDGYETPLPEDVEPPFDVTAD